MNVRLKHLRQEAAALLPGSRVHRARRAYQVAAATSAATWEKLDGRAGRSCNARARLIGELAQADALMSELYIAGWRTASVDQDIADGYHASSTLLYLIASTEVAGGPEFRADGPAEWEDAFGSILDVLTAERDLGRRAELLVRLYIAALPVVGDDAAEAVCRLETAYIRVVTAVPGRHAQGASV